MSVQGILDLEEIAAWSRAFYVNVELAVIGIAERQFMPSVGLVIDI